MQQHQKLGNPKIADSAVRNKRGPSKATPVKSFLRNNLVPAQNSAGHKKGPWQQQLQLIFVGNDFLPGSSYLVRPVQLNFNRTDQSLERTYVRGFECVSLCVCECV